MTKCKLTMDEVARFEAAYISEQFGRRQVQALRDSRPRKIGPISEAVQDVLSLMDGFPATEHAPRPSWVGALATHRSFFQHCGLRFEGVSGHRYFQCSFVKQSPLLVGMVEMVALPQQPLGPCAQGWEREQLNTWAHSFSMNFSSFVFTDEWPFDVATPVFVLTGVYRLGGGLVVSDASWTPFELILESLPAVTAAPAVDASVGTERTRETTTMWFDCPWLIKFVATGKTAYDDDIIGRAISTEKRLPTAAEYDVDAMVVMDALAAAREEWQLLDPVARDNFKWHLMGGKWLMANRGIVYDGFESYARKGPTTDLCKKFHMSPSASYFISVYTDEGAFNMACAWCHKMQYIFDKQSVIVGAIVSDAVLDAYNEPATVADLYNCGFKRVQARIRELRAIRPRL
jgi:hypothetical protein